MEWFIKGTFRFHILRTNCDTHSRSMKQNDDADDDCGAHSLCGSSYYQPYSFTTLCAARKFMRGVKRDNNQGGIQGSLLHDRVHPHQSEFEEGGGISSTSPPRHAFCGNPSPLPSPSSNNIAYSTNSSPHRPGILSQSNLESRTRFWKSPHRCRHNYRAMTDLEEKCCVDNDVGFEVSEGKPPTLRRDFIELKNLIISNWIYLFILLMPAAILSKHLQLQDSLTFSLSAITLMPLVSTHVCSPIEYSTCPFPNSPSLADSIVCTGEFVGRIHRRVVFPFKPMYGRPNKCIIWKCCGSHCSSAGSKS